MMLPSEHERRGVGLWVMLAGFAVAALLTLGAAVGASMLQQQAPPQQSSSSVAPMARR